jgi:hypothetical protein
MSHTDKTDKIDPLAEAKLRFPWGVEGEYDEERVWVYLLDISDDYHFLDQRGGWNYTGYNYITLTAPLPDPQRLHTMEEMEEAWHSGWSDGVLGVDEVGAFNQYYTDTFTPVTHRAMDADERIKWWGEQDKPSEMRFKELSDPIGIWYKVPTYGATHYRRTQDSEWLELPKVEV